MKGDKKEYVFKNVNIENKHSPYTLYDVFLFM
jgi:hypothetical protein